MTTPAIKSFSTEAGELSVGYKEENEEIAVVFRLNQEGQNFGFSISVPMYKYDLLCERFGDIDQSAANQIAEFLSLDKEVMRSRGGLVVSGMIH